MCLAIGLMDAQESDSDSRLGPALPFTVLPCKAPPVRLHLEVSPEVTCDHAREHVLECVEETVGARRRWGSLKERWRGCGKNKAAGRVYACAFLTSLSLILRAFTACKFPSHEVLAGLVPV